MRHIGIFVFAFIISASGATSMAAESKNAKGKHSSEAVQNSESEQGSESKSESKREEKSATEVKTVKIGEPTSDTASPRADTNFYALFDFSYFDLIIPAKYGATIGWNRTPDRSLELEYLRSSLSVPFVVEDLGSMTDERVSLTSRHFSAGKTFNVFWGLSYFRFSIHLGSSILNRVSGGNYPSFDVIDVQSLGPHIGIGNRWTFSHNITFGVDWISWAQPLFSLKRDSSYLSYATNQDDKDKVDTAIKVVSYFPRITLLKLNLGMSF